MGINHEYVTIKMHFITLEPRLKTVGSRAHDLHLTHESLDDQCLKLTSYTFYSQNTFKYQTMGWKRITRQKVCKLLGLQYV